MHTLLCQQGVSTLANYGVRINMLCPGFVNTNLVSLFSSEEHVGRFLHLKNVSEKIMEQNGIMEWVDSWIWHTFTFIVACWTLLQFLFVHLLILYNNAVGVITYRTDNVAKAFLALVKDESKNGEALMVHVDGAAFYSFPKQVKDFPCTKVDLWFLTNALFYVPIYKGLS